MEDRVVVKEVDEWISKLEECKQLEETQVKALCEKVYYILFVSVVTTSAEIVAVTGTLVSFFCGALSECYMLLTFPSFPSTSLWGVQ